MDNRGGNQPEHRRKSKQNDLQQHAEKLAEDRIAEKKIVDRIVYWIAGILVVLIILVILVGMQYFHSSLQPYDKNATRPVEVSIPVGASNKEIGAILQKDKVIKSGTVFSYYVKTHNYASFQAGYYSLKPSLSLAQVTKKLSDGGEMSSKYHILVGEGTTIDQIGDQIAKATPYSKKEFLALMKNQTYVQTLEKKYPQLLTSSMASKNVRYHLEGYLFPATYNYYEGLTLKTLVNSMVAKTNTVMKPYYSQIKAQNLTVQKVLTLASLVEREGVTSADRKKIAGVFFNRIDTKMPLQSDISVMYALNTHKKHLYNKDTAVKSPYNLYKNKGYGPGPFNSPSASSIYAVMHPADRAQNYLYFVANLKTGKVYYSQTFEQHTTTNSGIQTKNKDTN